MINTTKDLIQFIDEHFLSFSREGVPELVAELRMNIGNPEPGDKYPMLLPLVRAIEVLATYLDYPDLSPNLEEELHDSLEFLTMTCPEIILRAHPCGITVDPYAFLFRYWIPAEALVRPEIIDWDSPEFEIHVLEREAADYSKEQHFQYSIQFDERHQSILEDFAEDPFLNVPMNFWQDLSAKAYQISAYQDLFEYDATLKELLFVNGYRCDLRHNFLPLAKEIYCRQLLPETKAGLNTGFQNAMLSAIHLNVLAIRHLAGFQSSVSKSNGALAAFAIKDSDIPEHPLKPYLIRTRNAVLDSPVGSVLRYEVFKDSPVAVSVAEMYVTVAILADRSGYTAEELLLVAIMIQILTD